jgi:hypothetical protein
MVVEDVFDPQQLERKGDQKNVIGRIAALDNMKAAPPVNPPCIQEFPKKSATIFIQIPKRTIPFFGHGMPEDMDAIDHLVPSRVTFASGAQDGHAVTVPAK